MTLSANDRKMLDARSTLTPQEQELISVMLADLEYRATKHFQLPLAKGDDAAALEAAFIRYLLASKGQRSPVEGFPALDIDARLWKGKEMHIRAKNERRVVYGLLNSLFEAGFVPTKVYDGEEFEHLQADGVERIKEAMETVFNLDESRVYVVKEGSTPHPIVFVLGNADDGSEVVADWGYSTGDGDGFNAAMEAFDSENYV